MPIMARRAFIILCSMIPATKGRVIGGPREEALSTSQSHREKRRGKPIHRFLPLLTFPPAAAAPPEAPLPELREQTGRSIIAVAAAISPCKETVRKRHAQGRQISTLRGVGGVRDNPLPARGASQIEAAAAGENSTIPAHAPRRPSGRRLSTSRPRAAWGTRPFWEGAA